MNAQYKNKMDRVCNYIYAHLDEDLTLEELSKIANFSKFHFHRQFTTFIGIRVTKFIQRLRLKRASYQLFFQQDKPIIDISLDAKFEYPESFARAFKKEFNQSPSAFRQQANWEQWNRQYQSIGDQGMERTIKVAIKQFAETKLAVKEHRAAPELVNESASQFIAWRKATGLSPITTSRTFGLIYDDPKVTAPADFRFDISDYH